MGIPFLEWPGGRRARKEQWCSKVPRRQPRTAVLGTSQWAMKKIPKCWWVKLIIRCGLWTYLVEKAIVIHYNFLLITHNCQVSSVQHPTCHSLKYWLVEIGIPSHSAIEHCSRVDEWLVAHEPSWFIASNAPLDIHPVKEVSQKCFIHPPPQSSWKKTQIALTHCQLRLGFLHFYW